MWATSSSRKTTPSDNDRKASLGFGGCDTNIVANQAAPKPTSRRDHWDATYRRAAPTELSWHQLEPTVSLELIDAVGVPRDAAVIDVGGGASALVDHLLTRGCVDLSVLDISAAALAISRGRLGDAEKVQLLHADIVSWQPVRRYDLWHDRAVFHFLVEAADQQRYLNVLRSAVRPGGYAIIATFAPDGPERCSGLPVARYGADDLGLLLDDAFEIVEVRGEQHITPTGIRQSFTWVAARASR
jgi:SAM-dependent methyltransferase